MNESIEEQLMDMTKEDLDFFLTGLSAVIEEKDLVQKDIAERANINDVNLSRVLNRRSGCTAKWRRKICKALGMYEDDLILIGARKQQQSDARHAPHLRFVSPLAFPAPEKTFPAKVSSMDVLNAVAIASTSIQAFVGQCRDIEKERVYWQTAFNEMPVSAMLIHDDIVVEQNIKSRSLKILKGKKFCDNCEGDACTNLDICPLNIAKTTATASSGYKIIDNLRYKLDCKPIRIDGSEYIIVLATEADTTAEPFNRKH